MRNEYAVERLLWLGLGQLGSVLARRLVRAGYSLTGVDPVARPRNLPVRLFQQLKDVPGRHSIVVACLPTPEDLLSSVRHVVNMPAERRPALVVNVSTVGPECSRAASQMVSQVREMAYVEAPVSGGVVRARRGRISIFWACERGDTAAPVEQVLRHLARTVIRVGSVAEASKIKLINNLLSVANSLALVEGLRLAVRLGVDPYRTRELLEHGTANSYAVRSTVKRPLTTEDTVTGFATRLALKDMSLLEAALAGDRSQLLESVLAELRQAVDDGYADHAFPTAAIDTLLEELVRSDGSGVR